MIKRTNTYPTLLPTAVSALLLAVVIWGVTPVATRYLVEADNQQITPTALLTLRYCAASIILLPLAYNAHFQRWGRKDQIICVFAGLFGNIGYSLPVTLGQVSVSAGTTALIIATEPIWIVILWAAWRWRVPAPGAVIGALIGLTGILVLEVGQFNPVRADALVGVELVMLGAFFWSVYCVLVSDIVSRRGTIEVTSVSVVIGTVPYIALGARDAPSAIAGLSGLGLGSLCLLSIGSIVVATISWNYGVAKLPGPRSGSFLHAIPIVGIIGGVAVLGEQFSMQLCAAATLVIAGVIIAQFDEGEEK